MFLTPGSRANRSARSGFRFGTTMLFVQPTVPPGWVRVTSFDDAALRIVGTATPASGGTNGFSTVMAQTTVGNFTISFNELPAVSFIVAGGAGPEGTSGASQVRFVILSTGSGAAHNHTITMGMKYVDAMIARRT